MVRWKPRCLHATVTGYHRETMLAQLQKLTAFSRIEITRQRYTHAVYGSRTLVLQRVDKPNKKEFQIIIQERKLSNFFRVFRLTSNFSGVVCPNFK